MGEGVLKQVHYEEGLVMVEGINGHDKCTH